MAKAPRYIQNIIEAICPDAPDLYLTMFNQQTALEDASKLIHEQAGRIAELEQLVRDTADDLEPYEGIEEERDRLKARIAQLEQAINAVYPVVARHAIRLEQNGESVAAVIWSEWARVLHAAIQPTAPREED